MNIRRDIRCGLHSNIPCCCIAWYILIHNSWSRSLYDPWYDRVIDARRIYCFYLMCPLCLFFRVKPSKLKNCTCGANIVADEWGVSIEEAEKFLLEQDFDWMLEEAKKKRSNSGRV